MAEGLQTPDGTAVDLAAAEREFAAMMAAPVEDIPAPPDVTREPPTDKPKPKRGRPPKDSRPRTAKAAPAPSKALPLKDYTAELNGLAEGAWLTLGAFPMTAAYAGLIPMNQPGLVNALNQGAQQNATVRGYIEKAANGGGGLWMIQLGVVAFGMGMQGMHLARDPGLRAQLAAKTQNDIQEYLKRNGLVPETVEPAQETGNASSDVPA